MLQMTITIMLAGLLLSTISFSQEPAPSVAIAQGQTPSPDYSWLNGKWEGNPPLGGQVQMELQVVKGNLVKGSGRIVQSGARRQNTRQIEGTIDGNKVELSYFGERVTVKYDLTFVDGALIGTGTNPDQPAPVKTTFKKIQ